MIIKDIVSLIRVKQWYKNLLIFLPLFFSGEMLNSIGLYKTILGFVALSFISSVNYIINDIVDIKKDKAHPEKKRRPLASGRITIATGILLVFILSAAAYMISKNLSVAFRIILAIFFLLTQLYSLVLKNEAFADIIMISLNFVIRAVSGSFVITEGFMKPYISFTPWLILCPFFLAMFLAVGKREADLRLLGDKAYLHKKVLKKYSLGMTKTMMIISTSLLIMSYSLYTFLSVTPELIITLPAALYCIFRYFYIVESGSSIARHPEQGFRDTRLVVGAVCWLLLAVAGVYMI